MLKPSYILYVELCMSSYVFLLLASDDVTMGES